MNYENCRTGWLSLKSVIGFIIGLFVFVFFLACNSSNVSAAETITVAPATVRKNILQDVYLCYKHGAVEKEFKTLESFQNLKSMLTSNADNKKVRLITGAKINHYQTLVPFLKKNHHRINCKEFFLGDTDYSSRLLSEMGKAGDLPSNRSSGAEIAKFLGNMGYDIKEKAEEEKSVCYGLEYTFNGFSTKTNQICQGSDGSLYPEGKKDVNFNTTHLEVTSDNKVCLHLLMLDPQVSNQTTVKNMGCGKPFDKNKTFDGGFLMQTVKEVCGGPTCKPDAYYTYKFSTSVHDGEASAGVKGDSQKDYSAKWTDPKTAGRKAISYLSSGNDGYTTFAQIKIKGLELRLLYQHYLTDIYKVKPVCDENVDKSAYDGVINWYIEGSGSLDAVKCVYSKQGAEYAGDPVNGVDGNGFVTKEISGLDDLIKEINGLDTHYSQDEVDAAADLMKSATEGGVEPDGDGTSTCASAGGAGSLGWIVCPVLEWLGDMAEGVYNEYVEPALQVSPKLFTEGGDATLNAWSTFRDIANVIFVIVLLVVIFSQLTGVGIDNYGIKKILPKLIVMAVLVNLSYVLCILAVDVSNILGNGFQSLFNGMSNNLSAPSYTITTDAGESEPINADTITGLTGVGILGMIVVAGAAIWASPAILISLLVAAIGVAVSIFFLFILLSARQAAILVMVVMSPIAVVMYVLPNTKNLFDRWLKMFEGLLFVYPICGLLVGAGGYVSKLLIVSGASSGNFIWSFMAMIVSIVPIFFIPTVLKSAFSAMGKMGGTLAGLGTMASRGATSRIRNSEMYRNAEQSSLERQARIRGGFDREGNTSARRRALGTILSGGRRNRQRNALRYQSMLRDRGSLEATEGENFMLETQASNLLKSLEASGATNNIGGMGGDGEAPSGLTGGLYNALRNGDRAGIVAYTDALSAKGEHGRNGVKAAYNAAVESGAISQQAANTFANNIMSNHAADYKNNARSMFEVANQINRGGQVLTTGQQMEGSRENNNGLLSTGQAYLANRASAGTMGNMDDEEFASVFGRDGVIPSNLAGVGASQEAEDQARMAIGATAYAALNDQNANIRADRRQQLQSIVDQSGYTAPTQTVRIDHSSRSQGGGENTPTPPVGTSGNPLPPGWGTAAPPS